jgi:predicted component of type VI protein secretion system
MSFARTFLNDRLNSSDPEGIGLHVEQLMQAVAPEWSVPETLPHVRASNLCFGVPMNWALNDADRQQQVCRTLRYKLGQFEPRFSQVHEIKMQEDEAGNMGSFVIRADARMGDGEEGSELETRLSLFDQQVEEDSP